MLDRRGPVDAVGVDAAEQRAVAEDRVDTEHAPVERWPDALEAFVGLRVPLDGFADAFAFGGVKATLALEDAR